MKPVRKKIPIQIVPLVTVSRNACSNPAPVNCTAPFCVIPRFSSKSPALAHTTIAKTRTSVLILSLLSVAIYVNLVVRRSGGCLWHGNYGFLVILAALACPLQPLRPQFEEFRCFVIQPLTFVAVPQGFFHNAPHDFGAEVILIVKAVDTGHHLRFRKMRILYVWQLMPARIGQRFHF